MKPRTERVMLRTGPLAGQFADVTPGSSHLTIDVSNSHARFTFVNGTRMGIGHACYRYRGTKVMGMRVFELETT